MSKIALFPGTFDPITLGHIDVIHRSLKLFDQVVIGIGVNSGKQPMFTEAQRTAWIKAVFSNHDNVKVISYEGLTVDCCRETGAQFIVRGIRNGSDLDYEKAIADVNRIAAPEIETVFLSCKPAFSTISSTLVRDMIRYGRDIKSYLPQEIHSSL